MPKKIIAFLLAAAAILSLAGCQYTLDSEYEYTDVHSESSAAIITDTGLSIVTNYDELMDSIMEMIRSSTTVGKIRFHNYDGDPKEDAPRACMEVTNDIPIGAYAVYYIDSNVSKIVSDYQAQINITYKKTPKQISSIISANSFSAIDDCIQSALLSESSDVAIETSLDSINTDYVSTVVKDIFCDTGVSINVLPEVTAAAYPAAGAVRKIVEISFHYPFSKDDMDYMESEIENTVLPIRSDSTDADDGKRLLKAFEALSGMVVRCAPENSLYVDNTAYGALVNGQATDFGMATAFKLLANKMGYECYVVEGRLKSIDHHWNIVKLGDHYYHCDPYNAAEKSVAACFLRTDAEISREYWWETDKYKVCDGDLNYFIVSEIYEQQ